MRLATLVLLAPLLAMQRGEPGRFTRGFENTRVDVNVVELAPGAPVRVYQYTHDVVWIALTDGEVRFGGGDSPEVTVRFRAGDARLFRSFQVQSATNVGTTPLRAAAVQLKDRGLTTGGCGCSGATERAVCGCRNAPPLPAMWALGVGQVTLAAATLDPGDGFRFAVRRNDMLLVAVSGIDLRDEAVTDEDGAVKLRLASGDAMWLSAGRHRLRNSTEAPARFVTIEF